MHTVILRSYSPTLTSDNPSAAFDASTSKNFCTFPLTVIGNASTKRTCFGTLKWARSCRQSSRRDSAVASAGSSPSWRMMHAHSTSPSTASLT